MRLFSFILLSLLVLTLSAGCQDKPHYTGEKKNDLPHGSGVLVYPSGVTYAGQFQEGKLSGEGTWTHPSGSIYEGEWKNNLYHGWGTLIIPNTLSFEGEFMEGLKDGYGTLIYADQRRYEGAWQGGFKHGKGTMVYADGSVYSGTWNEGSQHEEGTLTYADGSRYEGQWERGQKHGKGTMIYADGSRYFGQWKNDLRHGEGTIHEPDGTVRIGLWEYGQLVYIPVQSISLNSSSLFMILNEAPVQLKATIEPEDATDQEVSWSSSRTEVALVSDGLVTPIQAGRTTITATAVAEGLEASCEIFVRLPVEVTGITINRLLLIMRVGEEPVQLETTIEPENADNQIVTWSSSNPEVASVSSQGQVTALKSGETTITAETADGGFTASCWVMVN